MPIINHIAGKEEIVYIMALYCIHCDFTMHLAAWSEGSWCHSKGNVCTNMVHLWGAGGQVSRS